MKSILVKSAGALSTSMMHSSMNFTKPVGQMAGFIVDAPPTPSRLL